MDTAHCGILMTCTHTNSHAHTPGICVVHLRVCVCCVHVNISETQRKHLLTYDHSLALTHASTHARTLTHDMYTTRKRALMRRWSSWRPCVHGDATLPGETGCCLRPRGRHSNGGASANHRWTFITLLENTEREGERERDCSDAVWEASKGW